MIEVKNNWNWISEHVEKELEDEKLYDKVFSYMMKYNISIGRMKELYHDAVDYGMTDDGKYLSFREWFQEFTELEKEREEIINDFI